jgi:methyl-accepting chemotaxis protein
MKKISSVSFSVLITISALFISGCSKAGSFYAQLAGNAEKIKSLNYLAGQTAEHFAGMVRSEIRALETLAAVMGDYEGVPPGERRDRFDRMLLSVIQNNPNIAQIYTVWKPNALDGMDSRYIGRAGSTPTGQYATAYGRGAGRLAVFTSKDVDAIMEYMNGPYARRVFVGGPAPLAADGKEIYAVNLAAPVINPLTNEAVGSVGCFLSVGIFQPEVEKYILYYEEIAAMEIYSSGGVIAGSVFPERVGEKLTATDTVLYGDNILSAYNAVQGGEHFYCKSYLALFKINVDIVITPFNTGGSDYWSVMIAAPVK